MKFIKKHKLTVLAIFIYTIIVILAFFARKLFFINSSSPEYGDRLDGIEEVKIEDEDLNKVETSLKKNGNVTKVTFSITGRTLDIVITVKDNTSLNDAKTIGNKFFSDLNEKQVLYYAIQVFIQKEDLNQNNFPIIGYKQKETKSLVWTKDRKVTTTNETK